MPGVAVPDVPLEPVDILAGCVVGRVLSTLENDTAFAFWWNNLDAYQREALRIDALAAVKQTLNGR